MFNREQFRPAGYVVAWLIASLFVSAPARGAKLAVRGDAVVDVHVGTDGDAQEIRGTLRDDVGQPLAAQRLEVSVLDAVKPVMLAAPRSCGQQRAPTRAQPDAYMLETDAQGVFCVRTAGLPTRGRVRVRFGGGGPLEPKTWEEAFDIDKRSASLTWDPLPDSLDLDARTQRVGVRVSARAGSDRPMEGVWLSLTDERGASLGRARTDVQGRAAFDVVTASLAPPGVGELVARTEDDGTSLRAKIARTAKVTLVGAAPSESIVPHDGHSLTIAAETNRGPADAGTIEARVGSEVVGTAAVVAGRAQVQLLFDVPTEGTLEVAFSYMPASSGLRGGAPLLLRIPVRPPSLWRKAPLFGVAAVLLFVLAQGWRRLPRPAQAPRRDEKRGKLPELVILPEVGGGPGLRGVVLDAHERRPLAGLEISVRARDFEGDREVASTTSDDKGEFSLLVDAVASRVLVVEGPLHARVEVAMPTRGRAQIALQLRRRALLERLMDALRKAGPAWGGRPEPTPAAVAKIAEHRARADVAAWARAVEGAAYGAPPVDASIEANVRALERELGPEPAPKAAHKPAKGPLRLHV